MRNGSPLPCVPVEILLNSGQPWGSIVERRSCTRINEPFPVTVNGTDPAGQEFQSETLLDNLSAGGLYMRLARHLEPGAKLSFVVRMASGENQDEMAPRIAAKGIVLRVEPQADGRYGLGVAFTQHRFL